MAQLSWSVSLTLVLSLLCFPVLAAPPEEASIYDESRDSSEARKEENKKLNLDEENFSLTKPKEDTHSSKTVKLIHPFSQSISLRMGAGFDPKLLLDGEIPTVFGVTYMFPRTRSPKMELGFDLFTDSRAHFSALLRRVFYERNSFRPFVRAGLSLSADAEERLATFSNSANYMIRAGLGFEKVVSLPMSFRFDAEAMTGLDEQILLVMGGFSWAW